MAFRSACSISNLQGSEFCGRTRPCEMSTRESKKMLDDFTTAISMKDVNFMRKSVREICIVMQVKDAV